VSQYRGEWADTAVAAIDVALFAVQVARGEYVECQYGEGLRLEPVGADRPAIDVEVVYSTVREQYRAVLRQVPCLPAGE
jgi:hypothetical protein